MVVLSVDQSTTPFGVVKLHFFFGRYDIPISGIKESATSAHVTCARGRVCSFKEILQKQVCCISSLCTIFLESSLSHEKPHCCPLQKKEKAGCLQRRRLWLLPLHKSFWTFSLIVEIRGPFFPIAFNIITFHGGGTTYLARRNCGQGALVSAPASPFQWQ